MSLTEEVTFDNRQRGNERPDSQRPSEPVAETFTFDKQGNIEKYPWIRKFFLSMVIILVALLSFGLGRLSGGRDGGGIKLEFDSSISNSQFPISNETQTGNALNSIENSKLKIENSTSVVASSKGTKYHYPHCSGAKRITDANKIVFSSPEAAEASGYTLAANCKPK